MSCGFVQLDGTIVDYSWDIPETRVANYICENSRGEVIELPTSSLNSQNIAFYWTDGLFEEKGGKLKKVKCTVTLDTGEQMTAEATFKVKLPEITYVFKLLYGVKYFEGDACIVSDVDNDFGLFKGSSFNLLPPPPGKGKGFDIFIRHLNEEIGEIAWVQIINYANSDWWYYDVSDPHIWTSYAGLDKEILFNHTGFSDSPGIGLNTFCFKG